MIADNNVIFDMREKGETTGRVFEGRFVLKLFLTLKQRNAVAVEYSRRDAGNDKDQTQSIVNQTIAEMQARIVECPSWFKGEDVWELVDIQPILAIRREVDKGLEEYAAQLNA